MSTHKNKTLEVIRFEVTRSLKKPSFWLAAIMVPVLMAAYILIAAMAGYSTEDSITNSTDTSDLNLGVYDEPHYLAGTAFTNSKGNVQTIKTYSSKQQGIDDVKAQKLDVFYYIPTDFATKNNIEVYTKPAVVNVLSNYTTPINQLLTATATTKISPTDLIVITGKLNYTTTTFDTKDDHVVDPSEAISQMAMPAIALAIFYLLIIVLGNRLTAAMVEEKENRISELILTSIKPSNLIVGKIISLMILGIIQLIVLLIPMLIIYKVALNMGVMPANIHINFELTGILQSLALLIASYFLFTALCVLIGTISPTAKDANSYSAVIVILVILPILFVNVFIGDNNVFLMHFFSFFPPSAPIALMLRGIFGTLPTWELFAGLADIIVSGILITKLETYIFCKNAIEFTPKFNFKKLLGEPRKSWKK